MFDSYVDKARINIDNNQLDTAISQLQKALNYKSSSEIESLLANVQKQRKQQLFEMNVEKGEIAFTNQNYEDAVRYFTQAQGYGYSESLQSQIEQSTQKRNEQRFQEHFSKGRAALDNNNYEEAIEQLTTAQKYSSSDEVAYLLEQATQQQSEKEYQSLVSDGEIALRAGNLNEAIAKLEQAKKYKTEDRVDALLSEVRQQQVQNFDNTLDEINIYIEAHNWEKANDLLQQVESDFPEQYDESTKNKHQFTTKMLAAEIAESNSEYTTAREKYDAALSHNIETNYVQNKYERLGSYDYKITVHNAVILPWKPTSRKQWDGFSPKTVDTGDFISQIAKLSGPQAVIASEVTNAVVKWTNSAKNLPDCFVEVTFDGKRYGGEQNKNKDDCIPHWDLSFDVSNTNPVDDRILNVKVTDKDLSSDDNVGSYQVKIGELLEESGVHYIQGMVNGELQYGAILLLKISVERS